MVVGRGVGRRVKKGNRGIEDGKLNILRVEFPYSRDTQIAQFLHDNSVHYETCRIKT